MRRKSKIACIVGLAIIASLLAVSIPPIVQRWNSYVRERKEDDRSAAFSRWRAMHYRKFNIDAAQCLLDGDTAAYQRLFGQKIQLEEETSLYYALLMADYYRHGSACHDVYLALRFPYPSLDSVDVVNKRRSFKYLKIGAVRGDSTCNASLRFELTREMELHTTRPPI